MSPRARAALREIREKPKPSRWPDLKNTCVEIDFRRRYRSVADELRPFFVVVRNHGRPGYHCGSNAKAVGTAYRLVVQEAEEPAPPAAAEETIVTHVQVSIRELDLTIAKYVCALDVADAKDAKKLRPKIGALRRVRKNLGYKGAYVQKYKKRAGRWTGVDGSLQTLPRVDRPKVLPGLADYDIVNCYFTLLDQLVPGQLVAIHEYVLHREEVLARLVRECGVQDVVVDGKIAKTARDVVKTDILLASLFGKGEKKLQRLLGVRRLPAYLLDFRAEIAGVKEACLDNSEYLLLCGMWYDKHPPRRHRSRFEYWNKHLGESGGYDAKYSKARWEQDLLNSAFAEFLATKEDSVITVVDEYVRNLGHEIRLRMHDGVMLDVGVPMDLEALSSLVLRRTGLRVQFVRKS